MKKSVALIMAAVVMSITGLMITAPVSAASNHATTAAKIKVGLAAIQPVQDKGFNSLAFAGLKKARKKLHVQTDVITTAQNGNYQPVLQEFVNNHYSLVIAVGALWGNALYTVASANPKVKFAIVDGYPLDSKNRIKHLKNVATLQFKSEQSGYIVGLIAGLMEKNHIGAAKHNTIAALGAIPLPFINAQMCGYWEGAKSVDKSVKFHDAYVYSFDDPTTAQSIGEGQIQKDHADILFGVADASGLGYYRAAADAHKYAIGFAADQDGMGSYMLTSAEVGINVAVFRTIQNFVNNTFRPNKHEFTLANGGISYAQNMHHVTPAIQKRAAAVAKKLSSGKLVANPNCTLPKS